MHKKYREFEQNMEKIILTVYYLISLTKTTKSNRTLILKFKEKQETNLNKFPIKLNKGLNYFDNK